MLTVNLNHSFNHFLRENMQTPHRLHLATVLPKFTIFFCINSVRNFPSLVQTLDLQFVQWFRKELCFPSLGNNQSNKASEEYYYDLASFQQR